MLLACQEVMVEESAQEVSPQCAVPNVFEHGKDHADDQSRESFTQQVHDAVDMFCTQYAEQADYVSYFQRQWGKKTGQCVSALA